jgi:hypothetical protein
MQAAVAMVMATVVGMKVVMLVMELNLASMDLYLAEEILTVEAIRGLEDHLFLLVIRLLAMA